MNIDSRTQSQQNQEVADNGPTEETKEQKFHVFKENLIFKDVIVVKKPSHKEHIQISKAYTDAVIQIFGDKIQGASLANDIFKLKNLWWNIGHILIPAPLDVTMQTDENVQEQPQMQPKGLMETRQSRRNMKDERKATEFSQTRNAQQQAVSIGKNKKRKHSKVSSVNSDQQVQENVKRHQKSIITTDDYVEIDTQAKSKSSMIKSQKEQGNHDANDSANILHDVFKDTVSSNTLEQKLYQMSIQKSEKTRK
eukprot:403377022